MIRQFVMTCVLAASATVAVLANHPATFVLRNGDRVNGELTYKGGSTYTLNGRDYPSSDVAVIAFVPDDPAAAELQQIPRVDNNPTELERHVFVTRDGQVIFGKLHDISRDGENINYDRREGGRHDISSNQLARIYINPAAARNVYAGILRNAQAPVATSGASGNNNGGITVNAIQPWTDTGIDVRAGDQVVFSASGQIRIARGTAPEGAAGPDGSSAFIAPRNNYPVPAMPVGGLIGRVGTGAPFPIGTNRQPMRMPANGRLYLGVNDDEFSDNTGAFNVTVIR